MCEECRHIAARVVRIGLCLLLLLSTSVQALELWSNAESGQHLELNTTLKLTGLAAYNQDDQRLFPQRKSATALARTRFELNFAVHERVDAEMAYEQRARRDTRMAAMPMGSALGTFAPAPWRIAALDWQLARDEDRFSWRHEIDRAQVTVRADWGNVIAGRQAIGFGRGAVFSAVNVFAPFSPTEVDREWRRGVDGLRIEYRVTPLSALELIAVSGDHWDNSALLGRLRGYAGNLDGEFIVGKRGRDAMFATSLSTHAGGAALYGEAAVFNTPESQPDSGLLGNRRLVSKAVLGASYTFNVGNGLTLLGEYHYSGFGVKHIGDIRDRLRDAPFIDRQLRGDSQIVGRHALAGQLSYPVNDVLSGSLLLLGSPVDGSGLASPGLVWMPIHSTTLTINAFLPWGAPPKRGLPRSEYGTSPWTLFTQMSLYF